MFALSILTRHADASGLGPSSDHSLRLCIGSTHFCHTLHLTVRIRQSVSERLICTHSTMKGTHHATVSSRFGTDTVIQRRSERLDPIDSTSGTGHVRQSQQPAERLEGRRGHTVQCRGRTMACGAAADGTVLGIHSTCAHAGLLAVRGHGNAGVPPIRTVVVASVSGGISKWWHHPAWPANARNPSPPKGKTGSRNVCSLSQRSDRSVISGRSVAHVGASGRSGCRRFRLVGHHSFGGQEQACDGGCVLQGGTGDLDRVGDAGGQ